MTKSLKIKPLLIDSQAELGTCFLFDWKTAPWHKLLIINKYLFAIKLSNGFCVSQLFLFWKELNKKQAIFSMRKKCTHLFPKWKQLK